MTDKRTTRRRLLTGSLRAIVGGAIVGVSAWLSLRSVTGKADAGANTCIGDSLCRNCSRLESCILPLGVSTRQGQEK